MSSRNPYEVLVETASLHPQAPAIESGRAVLSYGAFLERVKDLRDKLLARGVQPGDRVALMVARDMDEPALLFAVSACRAVFVSMNRLWKPSQVAYGLRTLAPRFFISGRAMAMQLAAAEGSLPAGVTPLSAEDLLHGPAPSVVPPSPPAPSPLDLAAIIFTSGSSGFPKGVMHTNSALLRWTESTVRYLGNRPGDRVLAILPLAFGYGLNQLLSMVHCGGCYRISTSVLMPDIVEELAGHQVTGLAGIPNFWRDFARALPELGFDGQDFALRYVTNAGGHCPAPVLAGLRHRLDRTDVVLMYGTTETLRSAYLPPHLLDRKMGAIGVAVPGAEVLLLGADGKPCRPGEVGEIVHRGPTVAQGYFGIDNPHCDRFRPAPDWLEDVAPGEKVCFTGDLARQDEDGILWFETRRDRQLKISGFRISPAEIEEVAKELGFVDDAVALCVKAPDRPDSIHLAVTLRAGHEAPAEAEVTRFLRQKVANYMVPAKVHFWPDAFPRTANGKTDYSAVERLLNPPLSPFKQSA
jgi:Acyl-CoA synthetases (AMP-forming)/AMP-acid ligases II